MTQLGQPSRPKPGGGPTPVRPLEVRGGGAPDERGVSSVLGAFDLTGRVAVITGGAGMLGVRHAEAVAELGASPVLLDLDDAAAGRAAERLASRFGRQVEAIP